MQVAILIPCRNEEAAIGHVVYRMFADVKTDVYVPERHFNI